MNDNIKLEIQVLGEKLRQRFPVARVSLDAPAKDEGVWFLDINFEGHFVIIQWRQDRGFGISCSQNHYLGEGADEACDNLEAAYNRAVSLLLSGAYTTPSLSAQVRED